MRTSVTLAPSSVTTEPSRSWDRGWGERRWASRKAMATAADSSTKMGSTICPSAVVSTTAWVCDSASGMTSRTWSSTSSLQVAGLPPFFGVLAELSGSGGRGPGQRVGSAEAREQQHSSANSAADSGATRKVAAGMDVFTQSNVYM